MLAKAVILDPELTLSVPAKISATTGLDALTQLIESCTSNKRKPATSTLSYMALKGATKALLEVVKNPSNLEARSKMMIASAVSGICLANSGLGMAHGIASALGAIYKIPHGEACGILLPHVVEYNSDAVIGELREAFAWMIEQPSATGDTIELGIKELKSVVAEIGVAADLKFLNLNDSQIRELAQKSIGNSLRGNPIPVDEDAVYEFLKRIA